MNKTNYIVSPLMDFILLGGASLIVFPLIMLLFPVSSSGNVHPFFYQMTAAVVVVSYLANFPHFAYSYQLMYDDFFNKIKGEVDSPLKYRYIFAGIIVPAAMILFFLFCMHQGSSKLLAYAVNIMLLTAGWHYAKQGFGMLIVCSVYKKVFYSPIERKLLLINAHLLWVYAWVMFNTGSAQKFYVGITFQTFGFPKIIENIFFAIIAGTSVSTVYALWQKYKCDKVYPSITGLTSYIATVYLWIILRFGFGYDHPIHPIILLIPAMHSIQYITIVLKMKQNEVKKNVLSKKGFWIFIILGVLFGAAIFDIIPNYLDKSINYNEIIFGSTAFLLMFIIFINIHHYFIDNVIWRREGSEPKNFLFNA